MLAAATADDGEVHLLVAPMLRGNRELIAGLHHDPQFGMTVMVGIGGVLAEAIEDVVFRRVPVSHSEALTMLDDLETQKLLGAFRGEPVVDRDAVAAVLVALSDAAEARPDVVAADLNPLIIVDGAPVAVDALIELGDRGEEATPRPGRVRATRRSVRSSSPRASSSPGRRPIPASSGS